MRTRGRKSAAELAVLVNPAFGERPDPPDELNERQASIWREVVASEDPKFFGTGALRQLLADYCRHREAAEIINAGITQFEPKWVLTKEAQKRIQTALKMRDLEKHVALTSVSAISWKPRSAPLHLSLR